MNSQASATAASTSNNYKPGKRGNTLQGRQRRELHDGQHRTKSPPNLDADKPLPELPSPNESPQGHTVTPPTSSTEGHDANIANLELKTIANLADLDFVIPPGLTLDCQGIALYKANVDTLTRIHMLLDGIHLELNGLMGYVNMQQAFADQSIMTWKEKVVTSLMMEIVPRLGGLIQRVGKDIEVAMLQNDAAVRVFVGGR